MILSHIYDVLIRCLFPHVSNRMELRKKAYFLGFMLSFLGIISNFNSNQNYSSTLFIGTVFFILLFLVDMIYVIIRRLISGKSPFFPDRNHLHHKLLEKGFSRLQIIFLYLFATIIFGLLAIFAWNTYLKFITFIFVSTVFAVFFYLTWNVNGYQRRN